MRCIRHDQRPWVGNESNRAIRWGALGAYGNDSQEVVAAIGSCPLHLPSVMPPSFINQPLCTFMPWLKWQKVLQCGHFHQKIKVWPSCQLCQHFFYINHPGWFKRDPSHQRWMAADFTPQGFPPKSSRISSHSTQLLNYWFKTLFYFHEARSFWFSGLCKHTV